MGANTKWIFVLFYIGQIIEPARGFKTQLTKLIPPVSSHATLNSHEQLHDPASQGLSNYMDYENQYSNYVNVGHENANDIIPSIVDAEDLNYLNELRDLSKRESLLYLKHHNNIPIKHQADISNMLVGDTKDYYNYNNVEGPLCTYTTFTLENDHLTSVLDDNAPILGDIHNHPPPTLRRNLQKSSFPTFTKLSDPYHHLSNTLNGPNFKIPQVRPVQNLFNPSKTYHHNGHGNIDIIPHPDVLINSNFDSPKATFSEEDIEMKTLLKNIICDDLMNQNQQEYPIIEILENPCTTYQMTEEYDCFYDIHPNLDEYNPVHINDQSFFELQMPLFSDEFENESYDNGIPNDNNYEPFISFQTQHHNPSTIFHSPKTSQLPLNLHNNYNYKSFNKPIQDSFFPRAHDINVNTHNRKDIHKNDEMFQRSQLQTKYDLESIMRYPEVMIQTSPPESCDQKDTYNHYKISPTPIQYTNYNPALIMHYTSANMLPENFHPVQPLPSAEEPLPSSEFVASIIPEIQYHPQKSIPKFPSFLQSTQSPLLYSYEEDSRSNDESIIPRLLSNAINDPDSILHYTLENIYPVEPLVSLDEFSLSDIPETNFYLHKSIPSLLEPRLEPQFNHFNPNELNDLDEVQHSLPQINNDEVFSKFHETFRTDEELLISPKVNSNIREDNIFFKTPVGTHTRPDFIPRRPYLSHNIIDSSPEIVNIEAITNSIRGKNTELNQLLHVLLLSELVNNKNGKDLESLRPLITLLCLS